MQRRTSLWTQTKNIKIRIKTKQELKDLLNRKDMAITKSSEIIEVITIESKHTFKDINKSVITIKNIIARTIAVTFPEIIKHGIQKVFSRFF